MKTMKRILCVLLAVWFVVCLSPCAFAASGMLSIYSSRSIPAGSVRMTAHRGYSAMAPENTLPAFRLAGEAGFWGAECDTAPTADGVWVIMHDDTVDRMTDGEGKVTELTFDEIRALTVDDGSNVDAYPGTKVPTLTEYLDVCREYAMHPVIEIKPAARTEDLDSLAALLSAREEKNMFTVITFSRELAARMKALMPQTPVFLLVGGDTQEAFQNAIQFCLDNGLDGMDFACVWEQDMVAQVQSAELETMVWTVDDVPTAEKYYAMGVRDFTTNTLTPVKPLCTFWMRLRWALRDLWNRLKAAFQKAFYPNGTVQTGR